jgi:hypothetical protein
MIHRLGGVPQQGFVEQDPVLAAQVHSDHRYNSDQTSYHTSNQTYILQQQQQQQQQQQKQKQKHQQQYCP